MFLKLAIRHFFQSKIHSFINIIGFSISITACLLLFLYVRQEAAYDNFQEHKDQLYRVVTDRHAASPAILGPTLVEDVPGVKAATRIRSPYINHLIKVGEDYFTESGGSFRYIDQHFFELFSFQLLQGDKATALNSPDKIILTAATAKKYFGNQDPIGQTLTVENFIPAFNINQFTVSGIVEDPPENSHFDFHILASLQLFEALLAKPLQNWRMNWIWAYLQLEEQADKQQVEKEMAAIVAANVPDPPVYRLQAMKDIYLHSADLGFQIGKIGSYTHLLIFSLIGLLVLLVAGINFVNLSVAAAIKRGKEVGIKKVLGGTKKQLVTQFLTESFLITSLSAIIALGLTKIALLFTEPILGFQLNLSAKEYLFAMGFLGLIVLLGGLLAGIYPALFLTRLKIMEVVQGKLFTHKKGKWTQRILLTFQFAVAIFIISSILIMGEQLKLIENKSLGFQKEQTLVVPCEISLRDKLPLLKNKLEAYPEIKAVGAASRPPGFGGVWPQVYRMDGIPFEEDEYVDIFTYHVGPDFIRTMGMEILKGRAFSTEMGSDSAAFVINESAAKELVKWGGSEWENPLGKVVEVAPGRSRPNVYKRGPIIGIVKDFNFKPLYESIQPLALTVNYTPLKTLLIKLETENIPATISHIQKTWDDLAIPWPFDYTFLDKDYANLYQKETHTKAILQGFAGIAILISCLGLWGLVLVLTEQKRKEISIRKILGSSLPSLLRILVKDYVLLILIAFLLALPATWYVMTTWLSNFAYQSGIHWTVFCWSLLLVLIGAMLSVSYVCLKAALANPVKFLRSN